MFIDETVSFPFFLLSHEEKKKIRIIIGFSLSVGRYNYVPVPEDKLLWSQALLIDDSCPEPEKEDSVTGPMNGARPQDSCA